MPTNISTTYDLMLEGYYSMIITWIKLATIITLGFFALIIFVVIFPDPTSYTQEEIDWCNSNRPNMPMETCAKEFGY